LQTVVGVNAWVIHNDPTIWGADVKVFRPERWLEVDPTQLSSMEHNLLAVCTTSPEVKPKSLTRTTVRSRLEILHRQEHLAARNDKTCTFTREAVRLRFRGRKGVDDSQRVVREAEY
jgi:hypothetical protein